jgi:hypothetical protein
MRFKQGNSQYYQGYRARGVLVLAIGVMQA